MSDAEAEMVEIDENLVRVELTVSERAGHISRRKELYCCRTAQTAGI